MKVIRFVVNVVDVSFELPMDTPSIELQRISAVLLRHLKDVEGALGATADVINREEYTPWIQLRGVEVPDTAPEGPAALIERLSAVISGYGSDRSHRT